MGKDHDKMVSLAAGYLDFLDDKTEKSNILWNGLMNYGKYGNESRLRDIYSMSDLRAITPKELVEKLKDLKQFKQHYSTLILINNAGITKDNLLMRMAEEDFDKVIEINLKSVFNMTKAVQRTMLKQRKGSIINMSSVVGVKGNAGQSNYAASKAGMIGFTKSIALELGSRNIRCNAIAPGFIETEMTAKLDEKVVQGWRDGIPLKRGGQTVDIANACLFFASDLSGYVTGQVLNVDGGMLT
ncbi:3-oxoacyl-[acyl-carrier-protein] reductase FabG [Nymphon striatum]|nr:3-oxoacyl-[acyl-carrier-protein] reductase FabG [Nymphon striatum]